jgi:N-acetylglucosaminyldiphosphoundecaprenol N-acetyl-beta-D-mannosaminyltransferase
MGVGGALDVVAGTTRRAPHWAQRIGMEWFVRFLQEPRRLFGRYARTNSHFVWLVARELVRKGHA